jgi:uracil-DNA glycosylase
MRGSTRAAKELLHLVRSCTLCAARLPCGPRPVLQLDPRASILIAGQAPGRKVHESGVPFQDASGERLREWLGVDATTFYDPRKFAILPMGFCYPGTGKSGDLPPRPECAPAWRARLLALLVNVELTVVIGRHAQAWHLDEAGGATVTATVKAWREFWPRQLPVPHPSPRNNLWLRRNAWFQTDVLPNLRRRVRQLTA